jgi:hypothetical protein
VLAKGVNKETVDTTLTHDAAPITIPEEGKKQKCTTAQSCRRLKINGKKIEMETGYIT